MKLNIVLFIKHSVAFFCKVKVCKRPSKCLLTNHREKYWSWLNYKCKISVFAMANYMSLPHELDHQIISVNDPHEKARNIVYQEDILMIYINYFFIVNFKSNTIVVSLQSMTE